LAREVINPQNGHILCDRNSRAGGLSVANSFPNNAVMKARRLRSRLRNGRKTGSINPPSLFLPLLGNCSVTGVSGRSAQGTSRVSPLRPVNHSRPRSAILCGIAHIAEKHSVPALR